MRSIHEKYRPTCFENVLGQEKAVNALKRIRARGGFGGRAYWISGASGTGKTTIARLIADDLAESWHIEEIDAQDCTLDFIRMMEVSFAYRGIGAKTGKAWIINEAHGLRGPILSRFLTALENLAAHCAVVFTTTKVGQESLFAEMDDASPLLSRCIRIDLTSRGLAERFAGRAKEIAELEGFTSEPIEKYVRLAKDCRNNMRAILTMIEAGALGE